MKRNNLEDFQALLGHLELTNELLYIIDASPFLVCFVPAIDRLAYLLDKFPAAFSGLQIPSASQLRAWTDQARRDIGSWSVKDRVLGEHLNKSGKEACLRASGRTEHPLMGYGMWEWGTYAALLITKDRLSNNDEICDGFDQVAAWVIGIAIKYNLQLGKSSYFERSKINNESPEEIETNPYRSRVVGAAQGLLRLQKMLGPKDFFEALARQNQTSTELRSTLSIMSDFLSTKRGEGEDEKEHLQSSERLAGIVRLLAEKSPAKRNLHQNDDESSIKSLEQEDQRERPNKLNLADLDGLKSLIDVDSYPTFLPTIPIQFIDLETDEDPVFSQPTDQDIEFAADNDLALEEVVAQLPYILEELDFTEQEQDEQTLTALTENAADYRRRLAERQPTRISYVGLDARKDLARYLTEQIQRSDARGSASLLVALAWLFGRNPEKLSSQLVVIDNSTDPEKLPSHLAIALQPSSSCIWLKLNRPDVYPENSADARQTNRWLALPDALEINRTIVEKSTSEIDATTLGSALAETLVEIKSSFGISRAQLKNMLLETLISEEGHGCTAALIGEINDLSMNINLHYLSPPARHVERAYSSAVFKLLGLERAPEISVQQSGFVGMHMCPSEGSVIKAISDLASFSGSAGEWRKTHNQITISTMMLLAISLGARDALAYDPNAFEIINGYGVSHYREKGEMRVVVLPKILINQLQVYDQHMDVVRQLWLAETGTEEPSIDLFFLFDASGQPSTFHPKSFSRYLEDFGINYQTPLNGLRRLIFTRLYEHHHGPALDFFIGHAVEGRRPWAQTSGAKLEPLGDIARHINEILMEMEWPIVRGCSHAPR